LAKATAIAKAKAETKAMAMATTKSYSKCVGCGLCFNMENMNSTSSFPFFLFIINHHSMIIE
jgi:Pyruvate/2-oxoacid:ferredoxin oxidoreductase delta subunit